MKASVSQCEVGKTEDGDEFLTNETLSEKKCIVTRDLRELSGMTSNISKSSGQICYFGATVQGKMNLSGLL